MAHVIGIDLGTTYSCVAYLNGQSPEIIPNFEGHNVTPSVVSFTADGQHLVGNLALRQAITNPERTITAVKRLMGRKYQSPEVEEAKKRMPYRLVPAANGDVMIAVEDRVISPQEVSALILSYLKACAESFFGERVSEAVITVPAHFNDHQRQATKDAAKIAGLDILRVINEPTAASLAFGLQAQKNCTAAVFDMGGGTFDITILEIQDGVFHVLSTNGDTYLGGEDFDQRIVSWLLEEFQQEHGLDLSQDKFALQRIKEAAERAKRELSFVYDTEINLPFISSDSQSSKHILKKLSRARFEDMTRDLVARTIPLVQQALEDAHLKREDIQEVILVGGQTRMPYLRQVVSEFFQRPLREGIDPDEVVAMGAAIQAGVIRGKMTDLAILLDVTPFSLGIETENDTFQKIIERNTTIPTRKTMPFTTVEHNQVRVRIHVLEGENPVASKNKSLGWFDLVGLEPAAAGVPQIDVTFEIDADGILRVSARDAATGREQKMEIRYAAGLTRAEVQALEEKHQPFALPEKK
ncbi:MAG: molecular chaperone DnaK [Candidatus Aminicenantales bacterium]